MKRVYKHSETLDYKKRLSKFFNALALENLPGTPNDPQSRFVERKRSSVLLQQSDLDENLRSKHMLNLELEDENLGYYSLTHKVKLLVSENSCPTTKFPQTNPCKNSDPGEKNLTPSLHLKITQVAREMLLTKTIRLLLGC
jgi:hypothetical protein